MIDPQLFQRLTVSETQRYSTEIDHAIDAHSHWVTRISRALIARQRGSDDDLSAEPHRRCHFGRWYEGVDHQTLRAMTDFGTLHHVHVQVHAAARELLLAATEGPVPLDRLDRFYDLSEQLRTLLHRLRNELKQNLGLISRLTAKVFENAHEGVVITAPDGVILNVNRAFTEVTGYTWEEAVGQNPNLLYSGRQDREFYRRMWQTLSVTGSWQGEIWNRRKNGQVYPEWLSIAAVKDETGTTTHYVGIFSDITSEKENEERLYHLAHFDSLTELPNRMTFNDRLRQGLARARRERGQLAVMFLDLDGFKPVNDRLGHAAGDELLKQVAHRLTQALRESDTVARFGGDEFTLVLPVEAAEGAARVAEKVIFAVAQPYRLGETTVAITTSIGIALYPRDGREPDELVTAADLAMYQAKRAGKNRYLFHAYEMR